MLATMNQPTECPRHRAERKARCSTVGIEFHCGCWTASTAAGVRIFWTEDRKHSFTKAEVIDIAWTLAQAEDADREAHAAGFEVSHPDRHSWFRPVLDVDEAHAEALVLNTNHDDAIYDILLAAEECKPQSGTVRELVDSCEAAGWIRADAVMGPDGEDTGGWVITEDGKAVLDALSPFDEETEAEIAEREKSAAAYALAVAENAEAEYADRY